MTNYYILNNIICSLHTQDCSSRLTDQGQSAAATNETITYEEILTSRDVKGDYSLPSRP